MGQLTCCSCSIPSWPACKELPSSQDQQPVCLKGSLLLLNAILTDESEPIMAKNSSGCSSSFQVAACSPIQRTSAFGKGIAKGQFLAFQYLLESSNQLGRPPSMNKGPSRHGAQALEFKVSCSYGMEQKDAREGLQSLLCPSGIWSTLFHQL